MEGTARKEFVSDSSQEKTLTSISGLPAKVILGEDRRDDQVNQVKEWEREAMLRDGVQILKNKVAELRVARLSNDL